MGEIMNRVGIAGFVVLVLTYIVLFVASDEQQQELVDKWFLLKGENHLFCTILGFVFVVLMLVENWNSKRVRKMMQARIDEIAAEKTALQQRLLEPKELTTSKR